MPRLPNAISCLDINEIKDLVRAKSGLLCSSFSDIGQLRAMIEKDTGEYLSIQTLNRFFGLIKSDFHASKGTLNVLARFANYDSFDEFIKAYKRPLKTTVFTDQMANTLGSIFKGISPAAGNEIDLCHVCLNVFRLINDDNCTGDAVYAQLAKTGLGRKYLYENLLYLDKLNGHYVPALKYYDLHARKKEEFALANSICCLRYFLNADQEKFELHFKKIQDIPLHEIVTFSTVIIARIGAAYMFKQFVDSGSGPVNEKTKAVIKFVTDNNTHRFEDGLSCCILAEALLLAGAYNDALDFLYNPKIRFYTWFGDTEEAALKNQYRLLKLYAGICTKHTYSAGITESVNTVGNAKFHLLSKDFYSILFNLAVVLTGNSKEIKDAENCLERLIEKTGFNFFKLKALEFGEIKKSYLMDING
jgi:hypothetical protein